MFDWHSWIDLAEALLSGDASDEAHWRCAVSRAYYAVFNLNQTRLLKAGRIPHHVESVHFHVWRTLSTSPSRDEKRLAVAAKKLQTARVDADYRADVRQSLEDARHGVAIARRLVSETDGLPTA